MVIKRRLHDDDIDDDDEEEEEEGTGIPLQKPRGMLIVPEFVRRMISGLASDQIPPVIENRLRLVIRKEVEQAVSSYFDPSPRSLPSKAHREGCLQLRLVGRLPSPIFTGSKILADDGSPIRIELWDTRTNCIVRAGPLSTIKTGIVPLNGDFGSDDEEKDWNEEEFSANVVHERQGKRPLIVGEKSVVLQEGVAHIGDASFTDNSSWTWNGHFRLGARADPVIHRQERIKEARSGRFIVKDRRGEDDFLGVVCRKHYPPSLNDELWRLNKIAKDGKYRSRLVSRGITTVQEFLCWLETDPASLREMLGRNVPNKTWNAIVEHAASCPVNADEHESFVYAADSRAWLLFDCVCKLSAASFDGGQTFHPPPDLPVPQRLLLQDLKREAYNHMNKWIQVSSTSGALPMDTAAASTSSPMNALFSTYNEVEVPAPLVYPMPQPLMTGASYAGGEINLSTEMPPLFQSSWTCGSEAEQAEAHLLSRLDDLGAHIPTGRKGGGGWCKIRAVVTFGSLRRSAVARRRAKSGGFHATIRS